jgi:hypothetical protein
VFGIKRYVLHIQIVREVINLETSLFVFLIKLHNHKILLENSSQLPIDMICLKIYDINYDNDNHFQLEQKIKRS